MLHVRSKENRISPYSVLRFKFLFNLPANIESNLAKGDYDRIIDEYERAKSLYGGTDSEIFAVYLDEIERGVEELKRKRKALISASNCPKRALSFISNFLG